MAKMTARFLNEKVVYIWRNGEELLMTKPLDKSKAHSKQKETKLQIRNSTAEFLIFANQAGENGI